MNESLWRTLLSRDLGVDPYLTRAILLATMAHAGQLDKAGQPYILHPLRVMVACRTPEERIVAVLHDVVEDTIATLNWLRGLGFSGEVVAAVDALTMLPAEDGEDYYQRVKRNPLARRVKIRDLYDNLDATRVPITGMTTEWRHRLDRYTARLYELEEIEEKEGNRNA